MSRRALDLFVALGLTGQLFAAEAREARVIARGLAAPVGVAVRDLYAGATRVVIASQPAASAGVLHDFQVVGGRIVSRQEAPADATGAANWINETLLLAGETISGLPSSLDSGAMSSARRPDEEIRLGRPSATDRFAFAVDRLAGRLWRTRRVGERFTNLRVVDHSDAAPRLFASVVSPQGYLVALAGAGSISLRLQFRDPERPEDVIASLPVRGVEAPIELAYAAAVRPEESTLFVLAADGVYRLDAGASGCAARRVLAVTDPIAFAIDSAGTIYVANASGELLLSEADE